MKRGATVVLVSPRDPGNVGSIGRTVVGLGGRLAVVGPLGWEFDSSALRRAQLDYWDLLEWKQYRSWGDYVIAMGGVERVRERGFFFTAHARSQVLDRVRLHNDEDDNEPPLFVFGSETSGFRGLIPEEQLAQ